MIEETVSALYAQAEVRLLQNRLLLLTGVRYEKTEVDGAGELFDPAAVFQRDARGNFCATRPERVSGNRRRARPVRWTSCG